MTLAGRLLGWLPRSCVKMGARLQWRHRWLKTTFEWIAQRVRSGEGIVAQGVGRGLRIRAGHSNAGYVLGTSEPDVQHALELLLEPGMTVFDVGANVGFFTIIAARLVGPGGRVVSFEPVASNAEMAEMNARINGFRHVSVRREALGALDGEARFLLSEVPTWGRLADPAGAPARPAGETRVVLRCLDSLVLARQVPPPDFVKLDAEGAEADIIMGGATTLATGHPVLLIELHGTNQAVADQLDRLGYRSIVLGSPVPVRLAGWDAHVVAFAPADGRVASLAAALGESSMSA